MRAERIAARLGGVDCIGREIRSEIDLVDAIAAGLPMRCLAHALGSGDLTRAEAEHLVALGESTAPQVSARLSPAQSDRLVRGVRLIARAGEALGSAENVHRWLRQPNRGMAGRIPLRLLSSDAGRRAVERALGRIEHGVYG